MKTGTYGWKSVFAFTFRQTAKSKAFKVSSVIIIVLVFAIALLAGVLPALIGSRSTSDDGDITGDGEALVGTVYFADTTGITTGKDYEGFLSGLGVKINDCGKGKLPSVCYETYDKVIDMFDSWGKEKTEDKADGKDTAQVEAGNKSESSAQ